MTKKEHELLDCMASVQRMITLNTEFSSIVLSARLAELQGRVLALRCERGDVSALDEAAAESILMPTGGELHGLCPDCGCEFTDGCFACGLYAEAHRADAGKAVANG